MYISLALYTLDGEFVGYCIRGEHKLQSTNIYFENETDQLNEQLSRLNTNIGLKQHWPTAEDPDVVAILNDETFMPVNENAAGVEMLRIKAACELVARRRAGLQ